MADSDSSSRVLVIDHDPQIRELLSDLLTHDGYEVDTAENAPSALKLLLRHRYSLLIIDLDLPGSAGLELLQEVRGRGLRLPMLIASNRQKELLKVVVQDLGRAECLLKPFGTGAIRASVLRLLAPEPE